jgi:phosphoglucomutase/phosphomannomutase
MATDETHSPLELAAIEAAVKNNNITLAASENLRRWLLDARYSDYRGEVLAHIQDGKWKELDDAYWTVIPFGTGGRRGKMYPIGSNAINDRTIGESAQGVADYVLAMDPPIKNLSCAIAYDTRHKSRHFAELCAEIFVGNGFTVYFLDGFRSTPELSFAVRYHKASVGIMVTASHNPPSDNAVKVYWSSGAQVLPPHDRGIIEGVLNAGQLKRTPFGIAVEGGQVKFTQDEVDTAFIKAVAAQGLGGPRDLKILYTPLHGVGASAVVPALLADGFKSVTIYGPHEAADSDFTNVPGQVANPENPAVFDGPVEHAKQHGFELVMASDPDCDRLGVAAPKTKSLTGPWGTFTGNQIGALLCEYILATRKKLGTLSPDHYVVKTLVTTELVRKIATSYNVRTEGDLQVGFKYIAETMDRVGPDKFVFGCEESHGYLVGQYARDKDAAIAAMLLAEYAALLKSQGKTLFDALESLYWQHGYHLEKQLSLTMPGSAGMRDMQTIMTRFRAAPPKTLAGMRVIRTRDYLTLNQMLYDPAGQPVGTLTPFEGPKGDMVIMELSEPGNFIAARPSGTEPKIKFYMFTCEAPEMLGDLAETHEKLLSRIKSLEADLAAFAKISV